jgi:hypothetical protein
LWGNIVDLIILHRIVWGNTLGETDTTRGHSIAGIATQFDACQRTCTAR